MDISLFQLVIICATIAVVLGFGIRAARSVHSTKGFSVGGRSAGVPLVAGGIAGTCVGGGATVGTAYFKKHNNIRLTLLFQNCIIKKRMSFRTLLYQNGCLIVVLFVLRRFERDII